MHFLDDIRDFFPDPTLQAAAGFIKLDRMEAIYDTAQGVPDSPHRHAYYTIVWVRKAEGFHLVDFNTYTLGPEPVYFMSPGQIHRI